MKKVLFCLLTIAISYSINAQTIPDPGMETWRTSTSGSTLAIPIAAPYGWTGLDSLIIADGQGYAPFIGSPAPTVWKQQLFREDTIIHSGSHSAKIVTLKQDTLGLVPGTLTNTNISINVAALATGGSIASATTITGGLRDTQRVQTLSAWIIYKSGKDSAGNPGLDSGTITVQAITNFHGYDSVVGSGTLLIPPTDTFTNYTVTMTYVDTVNLVDTVRITFASSAGTHTCDSSVMYIDDVTTNGIPQPLAISNTIVHRSIMVYPNPANGTLFISAASTTELHCKIYSVSGELMFSKTVSGKGAIDISSLPEGMYFYDIIDGSGPVQRGKFTIVR